MPDLTVYTAAVGNHGIFHQGIAANLMGRSYPLFLLYIFQFSSKRLMLTLCSGSRTSMGLPGGDEISSVFPVSVEMISLHPASVTQQIGNDVVSKVIFRVRVSFILYEVILSEDVPVEYVDAHRKLRLDFGFFWLFLEFGDVISPVSHHESETGRVLPRHFHDSHTEFSPLLSVEFKKIAVVLFADLVS